MTRPEDSLSGSVVAGLVAMGLAVLVIANDFTALSVALPAMEKEFGADITTVQWVINGYTLVFGVLIVSGGRLADMFGRRRVFFFGCGIFAIASVIGGAAPNVALLLTCRAVMGVGGAMMWPAILGMTYAILPRSKAGLAGGLILGVAGFGNAIGPLLGGLLTDMINWRGIFFLNLPIAAFAMLVTWRVVAKDEGSSIEHRIDYGGIISLSVALCALLLALDQGVDVGWTAPRIIALFSLSTVALIAFVFIERVAGNKALVPHDVMKNGLFLAACITVLLMSAIFFASLLYLPQFMTKILGYSALRSGAGLLPLMGVFAITSFVAGPLYTRLGPKLIVSLGAAFLALGIFFLSRLHQSTGFNELVPGMVILGIGVGLFYSSVTTFAVTALDPSEASLAGGIVYMFQIAGGSIGLGVNTAIVATAPTLVQGIRTAFFVDAVLGACGFLICLLFVGGEVNVALLRTLRHHHRAHAP